MSWVWPPQPRRFTAEDMGLFDEPRHVKIVQPKIPKLKKNPAQGVQMPFPTSGMDGFRWSDAIDDDQIYDALMAKYKAAAPEVKQWGTDWYDTANQYVRNLASATGRSVEQVAGVMAAFSPRTAWDPNMAQATHFLLNYDPNNPDAIGSGQWPGLSENLKRAKRILAGGDDHNSVLAALAGTGEDAPKITSFYKNIMGDHDAVTIDAWMARALLGQGEEMSDPKRASNILTWAGAYDKMSDAVRRAAKDLGVTPRELQAIVWTHVNPTANYDGLTPENFQALEEKRTKNWQRTPPRKPLPDYTKGPAWDAVDKKGNPILPSPDYSSAPGFNRGAKLAFLLKLAADIEHEVENANLSEKDLSKPRMGVFPEDLYRVWVPKKRLPWSRKPPFEYKDTSRTYIDRRGEEHRYHSPHEVNPIPRSPMTGEEWPKDGRFEWDEERQRWVAVDSNEERGRPLWYGNGWVDPETRRGAPRYYPDRERGYRGEPLGLDFSDPENCEGCRLVAPQYREQAHARHPEETVPESHYTPIYRGVYVHVDDLLNGVASRTPEINTNDVSLPNQDGPSAEQLGLDFPVQRDESHRSRESIWDHPDLGSILLDHIALAKDPVAGGGLGRHWTTDPEIAKQLIPPVPSYLRDKNNYVPVLIRAMWGGRGENPDMPGIGYDLDEKGNKIPWKEDEINLIPDSQVFPTHVYTIPPGETEFRNVLSTPHLPREARRRIAVELTDEEAAAFMDYVKKNNGTMKAKFKDPEPVKGIPAEELEQLMKAQQHWEQFRNGPHDTWYHVSPHDLAEGTVLVPGGPDGKATSQDFYDMGFGDDTGTLQDMGGGRTQHVWLTPDLDDAHFWAATLGAPHIYEVETDDDPRPWNGTGTDGFVAPSARVKRKILSRRMARMKQILRTAAYGDDPRKVVFTPEEEGLVAELMSRLEYKRETGQLPYRHPGDPQGFTDALQELIQRNKEREYFDEDEYDYDKAYNDQIAGGDE